MTQRVAILLILLSSCGCVSTWAVRDEPRKSVQFATASAAQIFYDEYDRRNDTRPRRSGVELSVPLPYEHVDYSSDNVRFNRAVTFVDKNHDGVITDDEALAYARGVRPPPSEPLALAK